tara:strand:+ start:2099 stop:3289 length:1191 start_codon:yes stop_codon:yes gene_type:complete
MEETKKEKEKEKEKDTNILGEGAYGCVVQPSLECSNAYDTKGKVSKIMQKRHADIELDEFTELTNISGIDRYIITKPHMCSPKKNKHFRKTLKKCNNEKFKDNHVELRLLVMENGGVNVDDILNHLIFEMTSLEVHIFINRWKVLLEAICFFQEHELIHNDLKIQNIVYNIKSGQIRLIDFGKTKPFSKFIELSKNNINNEGLSWFNYPPESGCHNKEDFDKKENCILFRNTIPYDIFVKNSVSTFDMYSMGLLLKETIERLQDYRQEMHKTWNIPKSFLKDCHTLFSEMSETNIRIRKNNPREYLETFKVLLKKHKIDITDDQHPNPSVNVQKRASNLSYIPLQISNSLVQCNSTKEYNPFTKKCVARCKKGKIRVIKRPTKKRRRGVFNCKSRK